MAGGSQTLQVYARLRQGILSLELTPGGKLTERGLEARFGVSRTPARAALVRLETEGLVQRLDRGWRVAPIDVAQIRDLAEFRETVESAGVRLAAERATTDDIAAVGVLLDSARPEDAVGEEDVVRAGGDFHSALARLSGNRFFADAVAASMTRMARTRWLEVRTFASREQAWAEHRAVLDAVARHDAQEASALIVAHVRGTHERLLAVLGEQHQALRARGMSVIDAVA
jgi:DNA-binding GntR family transcriptional regulator